MFVSGEELFGQVHQDEFLLLGNLGVAGGKRGEVVDICRIPGHLYAYAGY